MSDYTFRLRFRIPPSESIQIDAHAVDLSEPNIGTLTLSTGNPDTLIHNAEHLILRRGGYSSEEDARRAGDRFRDYLSRALARFAIGADFGDRAPQSGFYRPGLEMLEAQHGQRALNNVHGLMVFETNPQPIFARLSPASVVRGTQQSRFEDAFRAAVAGDHTLTEQERRAYDIFSASYFETSQDARFLTLVMAVEILITPGPRSPHVLEHVEHLIQVTHDAEQLSHEERDSLLGSLNWLRTESIRASVLPLGTTDNSKAHLTG